jgi:hypothetical protein
MSKLTYGLLSYDVPINERGVYTKLRKAIRRIAIPINFSAYLIPWGARDTVMAILSELHSQKPNVIASDVIKFDDSEQEKLDQAAEKGLRTILSNAVKTMNDQLSKAEIEYAQAVKAIDDARSSKNEQEIVALNNYISREREMKVDKAIKKAKQKLDDATTLAVTFNLTRQIDYAAAEFQKLIEHKLHLAEALTAGE